MHARPPSHVARTKIPIIPRLTIAINRRYGTFALTLRNTPRRYYRRKSDGRGYEAVGWICDGTAYRVVGWTIEGREAEDQTELVNGPFIIDDDLL